MIPSSAPRSARTRSRWPVATPDHERSLQRARVAAVAGASGVVAGSFLPWVVSGHSTRNSFTTVRTARNLELVDSGVLSAVLAGWFLVPLAAAAVLLLAVLGRRRTLALTSGGLGLVAAAFTLFVQRSTSDTPLDTSVGPAVTLVFALLAMAAAVRLGTLGPRVDEESNPMSTDEPPPVR